MAGHRVCPWWIGYLMASPLRRLTQDPHQILSPHVREGMTVLEPGPGMGFFTVELARLVGTAGRVVAVDLQPRMLTGLRRRAAKAGVQNRIETRLASPGSMQITDLASSVDFTLAFAVVHEFPDAGMFFRQISEASKPGARVLFVEPAGHVNARAFAAELDAAREAGFVSVPSPPIGRSRTVLLERAASAPMAKLA